MKIQTSTNWSIHSILMREGRINPRPQYQRAPVWNDAKKQLLIDSILRGYDLPKFYLRSTDPPYEHEVVDGQQRLHAIWISAATSMRWAMNHTIYLISEIYQAKNGRNCQVANEIESENLNLV